MNEVTNFYGLIGLTVTTIIGPIVMYWVKNKSSKEASKNHQKIELAIKRLEMLDAFRHDSGNAKLVNRLYIEYGELGGNSYIDDMMEDWKNGTLADDMTEINDRLKRVEEKIK